MEKILVMDFGGQYSMLIARRVRDLHVYAEIRPYDKVSASDIVSAGYKGIIFTGGPRSVYDESSPHVDRSVTEVGVPVLGICYGNQLLAYTEGGKVSPAEGGGEYGRTDLYVSDCPLFEGVPEKSVCWMSHVDSISALPHGFRAVAHTDGCRFAAVCDEKRKLFGVQFHPEVAHTVFGMRILSNFLFGVCGCKGDWIVEDFAEETVEKYRAELSGKKVLLALSGGVDSTVAAVLLGRAIGKDLICVFVDHGLLRQGEGDAVEKAFREKFGIGLVRVRAEDRFLKKLSGVVDPEKKRAIIGEEFIRVFEQEAKKIGKVDVLAQGTIYPDVIESGKGDSAVIKSHHNVGGLPDVISFEKIVEPLRNLFKDEVRRVGLSLGVPSELVMRQPFPGPGLAVRIIGEVTAEKLELLRKADAIFREEVGKYPLEKRPDQFFAVLTDTHSVGVMGDMRTYGYTAALRAVDTGDFMTAEWSKLSFDLLETASVRITNEVPGISRVVYDISSKPPATVEWE